MGGCPVGGRVCWSPMGAAGAAFGTLRCGHARAAPDQASAAAAQSAIELSLIEGPRQ
jgi:hypothetical protein